MVDTVEWVGVPDSLFLGDGPSPAAVEPSGWLAVELDQYFSEPAALDDAALVDALVGFERVAAWAQAKQARLIAELAVRRDEPGGVTDWAADEVAAALHLSSGPPRSAPTRLVSWSGGCPTRSLYGSAARSISGA